MAYTVSSTTRAKRVAKDLKASLSELGIAKPFLACLDIVSRLYGHPDFRSLERAVRSGNVQPSLDDDLVDETEVASRHQSQTRVLLAEGIPHDTVATVLARIRPTGRAVTAPAASGKSVRPDAAAVHAFDALAISIAGRDFREVRVAILEATARTLKSVRATFGYDMGMVDGFEVETARWAAVDSDYAAPFRDGFRLDVQSRCRDGGQFIEIAAIGLARALCDARASGEPMTSASPDWREVVTEARTLRTVTDPSNWCMESAVLTVAERAVLADALALADSVPPDLDRMDGPRSPFRGAPSVMPEGLVPAEPGTVGVRFYVVGEDDEVIYLSSARYQRLMDGTETANEWAGTQVRVIDAYYERAGRKPVRLSHCIGLFRSFDREGRMLNSLPEAMDRMQAGLKARVWDVGAMHLAQVRRQMKLAA